MTAESQAFNENVYIEWGGTVFWVDRQTNTLEVLEGDILGTYDAAAWQKEMLDTPLGTLVGILRHMDAFPPVVLVSESTVKQAVLTEVDKRFYQPVRELEALVKDLTTPGSTEPLF